MTTFKFLYDSTENLCSLKDKHVCCTTIGDIFHYLKHNFFSKLHFNRRKITKKDPKLHAFWIGL